MAERFENLSQFWPYYLSEHLDLRNRRLHFVGTALTLVILVSALGSGEYLGLIAIPIFGYGCAWTGHLVFEKNRPATFQYPIMSLIYDYKMFWLTLTGGLDQELRRHGLSQNN